MPRSAVSPSVVLTAQKSNRQTRRRVAWAAPLAATLVLLSTSAVHAASLQQVNNWGATGVPDDITMYVYVPDNVVTNPPILTLVHYCGPTT
jgi:acetylxylan esterase